MAWLGWRKIALLAFELYLLSCLNDIKQLINAATFGSNIEDRMKEITAGGKTILVVIISTYTEGQR